MNNKKSTSIRIATWNLERPKLNGWKKNPLIQEKISEIDADIWILTETNASIVPTSKRDPLAGYVALASLPATLHSLGKYSPGENCSTIWSRFGIKRSIKTFDVETAVCAEIDTPLGLMLVYGTILTYHGDKGPKNNSKSWVEHDKEIARHGDEWYQIQGLFPHTPLIVAGDFNQTRDGSRSYCSPEGIDLLDTQLLRNKLSFDLISPGQTEAERTQQLPFASGMRNCWDAACSESHIGRATVIQPDHRDRLQWVSLEKLVSLNWLPDSCRSRRTAMCRERPFTFAKCTPESGTSDSQFFMNSGFQESSFSVFRYPLPCNCPLKFPETRPTAAHSRPEVVHNGAQWEPLRVRDGCPHPVRPEFDLGHFFGVGNFWADGEVAKN